MQDVSFAPPRPSFVAVVKPDTCVAPGATIAAPPRVPRTSVTPPWSSASTTRQFSVFDGAVRQQHGKGGKLCLPCLRDQALECCSELVRLLDARVHVIVLGCQAPRAAAATNVLRGPRRLQRSGKHGSFTPVWQPDPNIPRHRRIWVTIVVATTRLLSPQPCICLFSFRTSSHSFLSPWPAPCPPFARPQVFVATLPPRALCARAV
jgi:hypothetical protein